MPFYFAWVFKQTGSQSEIRIKVFKHFPVRFLSLGNISHPVLPDSLPTWLGPDNIKVTWRANDFSAPFPFLGFPGGSERKEFAHNPGDTALISGSGRSPGEENGSPH